MLFLRADHFFFADLVTFHFRWEMRKGVAHISPLSLADNVRLLPHRFSTHAFESFSPMPRTLLSRALQVIQHMRGLASPREAEMAEKE